MPREQAMCAAVSCGSAAADDVGLAGASLKYVWSSISGVRRFFSKGQTASCYVARLESVIHSAFLFADRRRRDRSGDFSQVLPHCRAFGPVLARLCTSAAGDRDGRARFCLISMPSDCISGLLGIR